MSRKTNSITSAVQSAGEPTAQESVNFAPEGKNGGGARQQTHCQGNTFVTCVQLVDGCVTKAWSTGRMMRNMNVLLRGGLDEHGHPKFAQQAHCLCNDGHALAAIRALENMAGVVVPHGAFLVRNLVQSLRCIQEHLLHFYQFHLSDWVSLESALRVDPAAAARLAHHPQQDTEYFRGVQNRLRTLAGDQEAGGFDGHPDYCGADELHLCIHAHGLESLRTGGMLNSALGLLGCGPNGFSAYQLGGLPDDMDLGTEVLGQLRGLLAGILVFVHNVFLPDLEQLASTYAHWAGLGVGSAFLSYWDFDCHQGFGPLFPGGIVVPTSEARGNNNAWEARPAWSRQPEEDKEPRWSQEDREHYRLQFGEKGPLFDWGAGAFAWLSVPRHEGHACEVGSLSRVLGAWAHGRDSVCEVMRNTLETVGVSPAAMNSTLGRVLSRGIESSVLAQNSLDWLDELESILAGGGQLRLAKVRLPSSGLGEGRVEVPRGTLTHTIHLEESRIVSHDYLIPSLWNFSPRDSFGGLGPLELALLGTPVADPGNPLEVLRTVHALDPCNICHVVVEDLDTGRTTTAHIQ